VDSFQFPSSVAGLGQSKRGQQLSERPGKARGGVPCRDKIKLPISENSKKEQ
jgi:hypothetical protein